MRNLYVGSVLGQNANKTICTKPCGWGLKLLCSLNCVANEFTIVEDWATPLNGIRSTCTLPCAPSVVFWKSCSHY